MGVIANKAVIVERELNNAKRNKNDFYSWFYVSKNPYKDFLTSVKNNPNTWRPTIDDVINEIATVKYIIDECNIFGFDEIKKAVYSRNERAMKTALCKYIDNNNYNPEIKEFILNTTWF